MRPPGPVTPLRSVGWRTARPSELSSAPVLRTPSLALTGNVKPKVEAVHRFAQFDMITSF